MSWGFLPSYAASMALAMAIPCLAVPPSKLAYTTASPFLQILLRPNWSDEEDRRQP
jgi:hypothetical protein